MRYEFDPDTLAEDMYALYEIIGEELTIKVIETMPGQSIYIPTSRSLEADSIHAAIRKEYDGTNTKALAAKYGYSSRHILTIVSKPVETFTCPDCGQVTERNGKNNRKRCAACAYKRRRELEKLRRTGDSYVYKGKPKGNEAPAPQEEPDPITLPPQPKRPDPIALQRERDRELDARSAEYIRLQCSTCGWALRYYTDGPAIGCDFVTYHGRCVNDGDGPGDCRDYAAIGTLTQEERLRRRRSGVLQPEATWKEEKAIF